MESKLKLYEDYSNLKNSIGALQKSGKNPHFKNTYVELNTALQVINDGLSKNSFITFTQLPCFHDDKNFLKTTLVHKSGEVIECELELITVRQDPQMLGSSLTYMRRYSLITMLGLQAVDDDGNEASTVKPKKSVFQQAKDALKDAESEARYDEAWGNVKKRKKEFAEEDWAELEKIGAEEKAKHVSGTK